MRFAESLLVVTAILTVDARSNLSFVPPRSGFFATKALAKLLYPGEGGAGIYACFAAQINSRLQPLGKVLCDSKTGSDSRISR
jgi:hypothetical protein